MTQPTARARARAQSPSPSPSPSPEPVCRFFLAQILTLRAHFHQILTLLSAFELQNLGFAQILTLLGFFWKPYAHIFTKFIEILTLLGPFGFQNIGFSEASGY